MATPYTYAWSGDAITDNQEDIPAGTYAVTVTDANGCTASASATVSQPDQILASATITAAGCDPTGVIDLTVSGGAAGYTFAWSTGATTEDLDELSAGTVGLMITDASGCTVDTSFTVGRR